MSKKELTLLVKSLNIGILPQPLDFTPPRPPLGFDLEKVRYNTYYRSFEFFDNKFPNGMQNLPGYYEIIDHMVDNARTPLEEILFLSNINNISECQ